MNLSPKKIVKIFYEIDLIHSEAALKEFLHPDFVLNWNSSFGFQKKNYSEFLALFKGMQSAFVFSRNNITHLLAEKNTVTVRHTFYAQAIERSKEDAIAHFISILEIKEGKIYKGYVISQPADGNLENLKTFL